MIDGKPYKSLKRNLTGHGMTRLEYRARYNLPSSYPMVAPGYSDARREVAKRLGLGQKPKSADQGQVTKSTRKTRAPKPRAEAEAFNIQAGGAPEGGVAAERPNSGHSRRCLAS